MSYYYQLDFQRLKEYSFASFALIAIYYLTKKDVINEIKSM